MGPSRAARRSSIFSPTSSPALPLTCPGTTACLRIRCARNVPAGASVPQHSVLGRKRLRLSGALDDCFPQEAAGRISSVGSRLFLSYRLDRLSLCSRPAKREHECAGPAEGEKGWRLTQDEGIPDDP